MVRVNAREVLGLRESMYADNRERAGSTDDHNRRVSPKGSIDGEQFPVGDVGDVKNVRRLPSDVKAHIDQTVGALGAGRVPNLAGLQGDLPPEKLPNVPKPNLPNDVLYGPIGKNDRPGDTQYGRPSSANVDWKNGTIPDAALKNRYAAAKTVSDLKKSVSGTRGGLNKLEARMKKLEQAQKKKK